MEKTWKPTVAGILAIVSGSLSFIGLMFVFLGILMFMSYERVNVLENIPIPLTLSIIIALAIPVVIADILAIVGGIYALHRRIWGLALAGSIAACFGSVPIGIASIVLTAMSKKEFE